MGSLVCEGCGFHLHVCSIRSVFYFSVSFAGILWVTGHSLALGFDLSIMPLYGTFSGCFRFTVWTHNLCESAGITSWPA